MTHPTDAQEPISPEISVVIPAYNEASRIRRSLETVLGYLAGRFDRFEVIVVDDGSRDRTREEVLAVSHPAVRCLTNGVNSGKGFSVRRGMLEAGLDPILFTDADLSTPIEEVEKLLDALRAGYDAAIASRRLPESRVTRSLSRRFLAWGFSALVSALAVPGFRDTQCGFKAFRRAVAREVFPLLTIDRWGFDVEVLAIALRRGLRVAEVPVRWTQSGKSGVRFGTPLAMAGELLRIRRNAARGIYGTAAPRPAPTVGTR